MDFWGGATSRTEGLIPFASDTCLCVLVPGRISSGKDFGFPQKQREIGDGGKIWIDVQCPADILENWPFAEFSAFFLFPLLSWSPLCLVWVGNVDLP